MKPFLRTLLLWLLIAALPIQGMAAAIQATCASEHQGNAIMMMAPDHHHDMAAHGHDHDDHQHVAQADDTSDASGHSSNEPDAHKHSTCSACASCCVGAVAPPSAAVQTPDYDNSDSIFMSLAALAAGFIPSSLERPPKRLSA